MALKLNNKWVWDFWFAIDDDQYHIFYLQADKALGDPNLRHWNVSIGHAKSKDLVQWNVLPDAVIPSEFEQGNNTENEPPDTCTTWTGCVYKRNSTWYMYYTGTKKSEKGLIQRICLATSTDLITWHKHQCNPVAQINPRWYDGLNLDIWHDASWRDPWVMKDPDKELYHMLVTCRVNVGNEDGRGAIGSAYSHDLVNWSVTEPLFAPGCFGEMEVPQIEKMAGRYYLFCSVSAKYYSKAHRDNLSFAPLTGLMYFVADRFDGPYSIEHSGFLGASEIGNLYSGKVIKGRNGDWHFLAFTNCDDNNHFVGEITDPIKIQVSDLGVLSLTDNVYE